MLSSIGIASDFFNRLLDPIFGQFFLILAKFLFYYSISWEFLFYFLETEHFLWSGLKEEKGKVCFSMFSLTLFSDIYRECAGSEFRVRKDLFSLGTGFMQCCFWGQT